MTRAPALLFDLDGTLIDSAADLTTALNRLRSEYGLAPLPIAEVTGMVGDGARKLVQRAMPETCQAIDNVARFLDHYQAHLCEQTTPYRGIRELLEEFAGRPMAVVTNKPLALSIALLERLDLANYFAAVIGGDSCAEKKPHPLPVREALGLLRCEPAHALMIGDHHTDLHAGRGADCRTCFCRWGFGHPGDAVPTWTVADPYQLAELLRSLDS